MTNCSITHTLTSKCAGFHDMGALAVAVVSAAEEGCVYDAQVSIAEFDALIADGVPAHAGDIAVVNSVRNWLCRTEPMSGARAIASAALILLSATGLSMIAQPEVHRNPRGGVAVQLTVLHRSEYGYNGSSWFHCMKGEC